MVQEQTQMKIHEFDPVIYPFKIWIVVDKSPIDIPKYLLGHDSLEIESIVEDTKNLAAFVMIEVNKKDKQRGALMFFRSRKVMTFELVAHESSHAAKYLFEHIGADIKEHEPFEFVIGWIADSCSKVKYKK